MESTVSSAQFKSPIGFIKCFHFTDDKNIMELGSTSSESNCSEIDEHVCDEYCLEVKVTEVLDPSYGMYVWPSAIILAKFIWHNRSKFFGKRVLELGAGTALPSVVAAKCGANVVLSDSERYGKILEIGKQNMIQNNVPKENFQVLGITWGTFSPNLIFLDNVDLVLGSDVFYSVLDFQDIIVTVAYIMKKNPKAEFWCTYEQRCPDWNIVHLLRKWNLTCEEVSIEELESQPPYCNTAAKSIQLFIFRHQELDF